LRPVRTLRRRSSTASMTLEHTSAITASSSRTSASVDGKGKRLARHSWSRRSIKWSADDSSKNSRCNGRCAGRIFCCRPGRGSSTRIWTTYSAVGIQIQVATTNAGARAQGGLTPDFFALSRILWTAAYPPSCSPSASCFSPQKGSLRDQGRFPR